MKAKGLLITFLFLFLIFTAPFLITPEKTYLSVCPSKLLFGVRCPVCGMGRAFSHIARGQINQALYFNKSSVIFYPVLLIAIYLVLINFIYHNTGKKLAGFNQIATLNRRVFLITSLLLGILILVYVYDVFTGSGEAIFNYKYSLWYWLKR